MRTSRVTGSCAATTSAEARIEELQRQAFTPAVEDQAAPVLQKPTDLLLFTDRADPVDDHGNPVADRIRDAAERVAQERPGLMRDRYYPGAADQGRRPGPATRDPAGDLSDALRRAAQ